MHSEVQLSILLSITVARVGLRIQTEHYHIFLDSRKHQCPQKATLSKNMIVIDVYDTIAR